MKLLLISSLEKHLPGTQKSPAPLAGLQALWGETVSFQILCRFDPEEADRLYILPQITCPGCRVQVFRQEVVPCTFPCAPNASGAYLTRKPALMPDPLPPWNGEPLRLRADRDRLLWVDVQVPAGAADTAVEVVLLDRSGRTLARQTLPLQVVPVELAEQTTRHSQWFYADCLCQRYGCGMFTEEFYRIAAAYWRCAAGHGVDTLLTPVLTPSLDVEPGGRRMRGQLVRVERRGDDYGFDFTELERWVRTARNCGIGWFEIAPFFTQWGAKHPVTVYAEPDGTPLFGWQNPADDPEYGRFLAALLPRLMDCFAALGVQDRVFFHISDEPSRENLEAYRHARAKIEPWVGGSPILDALSDPAFAREGLVTVPVVAEDYLAPFLRRRTGPLWAYSCCCQDKKVPNVFLSMPLTRARILGALLYKERLDGYLRWGYNFWFSQFSLRPIDPWQNTDADGGFPSGDAFLVYPGPEGEPVPSLRLKTLRDAWQDLRALQALEQRAGRAAALDCVRQHLGPVSFTRYPADPARYQAFRQAVNDRLLQTTGRQEQV